MDNNILITLETVKVDMKHTLSLWAWAYDEIIEFCPSINWCRISQYKHDEQHYLGSHAPTFPAETISEL